MKTLLDKLKIESRNKGGCTCTDEWIGGGEALTSYSPTSGEAIADVEMVNEASYDVVVERSVAAFKTWRSTPAPIRGQVVRDLGNRLRELREPLGELVTLEMGKVKAEGVGEVQEMIDICDFAVGLSRQLCGSTMHSERPGHRMYEQWHPLGPIGIVSAFNFPVAVWSWNAALAAVCGDTMTWKPSPQTPLTAIAVQHICNEIMSDHNVSGIFNLTIGDNSSIAPRMIADARLPLISFTGSTKTGKIVAENVGARMGKTLLELGGNNAIIVEPDANMDLAVRAILFGAVGTAGQRCTSTRRVLVHKSVATQLTDSLVTAYQQITIGDPLDAATLMGPLIAEQSVQNLLRQLNRLLRRVEKSYLAEMSFRIDRAILLNPQSFACHRKPSRFTKRRLPRSFTSCNTKRLKKRSVCRTLSRKVCRVRFSQRTCKQLRSFWPQRAQIAESQT